MADETSAAHRATGGTGLTIEAIVAVDSPREFRIHPARPRRGVHRRGGGARQLFTLSLRGTGTPPVQITASEKPVSDPQWSPDGRRLAFVRDDEIWIVEADGSRLTRVVAQARRWSRAALVARRASGSPSSPGAAAGAQVWLIDAPVPRRGRPQREPARAEATPLTPGGFDVEGSPGRRTGPSSRSTRSAGAGRPRRRGRSRSSTSRPARASIVAGTRSHDTGVRWGPDGSLFYLSDEDGWFQVVRRSPDGRDRIVAHRWRARARRTVGRLRLRAAAVAGRRDASSTSRSTTGSSTWSSASSARARRRSADAAGRRRRHGPLTAATEGHARHPVGGRLARDRLDAGRRWVAAIGESERRPQDLWLLPVPGVAPDGITAAPGHELDAGRPRVGDRREPGRRPASASHHGPRRAAGRGHAVAAGRGHRQARRPARADDPLSARRPDLAGVPGVRAVQAAARERRVRVPRRRLPRVDRLWPRIPPGQPRRVGPRRYARHDRRRAMGRRAALVRRPARDLRWVVRRVHGPVPRSSRSRRSGRRASTCTATRRSPRASATATGSAASTSRR